MACLLLIWRKNTGGIRGPPAVLLPGRRDPKMTTRKNPNISAIFRFSQKPTRVLPGPTRGIIGIVEGCFWPPSAPCGYPTLPGPFPAPPTPPQPLPHHSSEGLGGPGLFASSTGDFRPLSYQDSHSRTHR